jgi:hypothetical protein
MVGHDLKGFWGKSCWLSSVTIVVIPVENPNILVTYLEREWCPL